MPRYEVQFKALFRDPDSDQDRVLAVICRHLDSLPSRRAAEIGTSAHVGTKKPVREPLSIPGPARKDEIAGQTPYCADFLPLVHDEMLSAARASFSGWLCT